MRNRWSRDPELRLDFMLLNPERASGVIAADVDRSVGGLKVGS
jgi:hypothetical protein